MCMCLLFLTQCSSKGFCLPSLIDKFLPSPSRTHHASLRKDLISYFSKVLKVMLFHDWHTLCTTLLWDRIQSNLSWWLRYKSPFFLPAPQQAMLHSSANTSPRPCYPGARITTIPLQVIVWHLPISKHRIEYGFPLLLCHTMILLMTGH